MPISAVPSGAPTIPAGAQKVQLKAIDPNTNQKKEDVTCLGDTQRMYADPVLNETAAATGSITATCSASGLLKDEPPSATPVQYDSNDVPIMPSAEWVCTDAEVTYEVGKYATWSANWSYYA